MVETLQLYWSIKHRICLGGIFWCSCSVRKAYIRVRKGALFFTWKLLFLQLSLKFVLFFFSLLSTLLKHLKCRADFDWTKLQNNNSYWDIVCLNIANMILYSWIVLVNVIVLTQDDNWSSYDCNFLFVQDKVHFDSTTSCFHSLKSPGVSLPLSHLPDKIFSPFRVKGRISRFSACQYTDWPVHAFWHRPRFFIVYEPIVSKLPNFACKYP